MANKISFNRKTIQKCIGKHKKHTKNYNPKETENQKDNFHIHETKKLAKMPKWMNGNKMPLIINDKLNNLINNIIKKKHRIYDKNGVGN